MPAADLSPAECRVFELLEHYYAAIASLKTPSPQDLAAAVDALEAASRQPSPELPSALRHYMESRSYRKAWEFLGGTPPN